MGDDTLDPQNEKDVKLKKLLRTYLNGVIESRIEITPIVGVTSVLNLGGRK